MEIIILIISFIILFICLFISPAAGFIINRLSEKQRDAIWKYAHRFKARNNPDSLKLLEDDLTKWTNTPIMTIDAISGKRSKETLQEILRNQEPGMIHSIDSERIEDIVFLKTTSLGKSETTAESLEQVKQQCKCCDNKNCPYVAVIIEKKLREILDTEKQRLRGRGIR